METDAKNVFGKFLLKIHVFGKKKVLLCVWIGKNCLFRNISETVAFQITLGVRIQLN